MHKMLALSVAILVGVGVTTACEPTETKTTTAGSDASTSAPAVEEAAEEAPVVEAPTFYEPTMDDFQIKVKTLEKECFGSAGCLETVRLTIAYSNAGELDPDATYYVTYKIRGGEDPQIGTFEVTDGDQYSPAEEMIDTPNSSVKVTATVTEVEVA